MKAQTVKAAIKKKFGTMTKFAKLSKTDRYELQKLFAREHPDVSELQRIMKLVRKTKVKPLDNEIPSDLLAKLRAELQDYGGVIKFTTDHDSFSKDSLFQILSGRRTRMTDKTKEIFNHFNLL